MTFEFDRQYHPIAQDLRNITKGAINKIRKNTFDQHALEILLQDDAKQRPGFQHFLRKYKMCDGRQWYVCILITFIFFCIKQHLNPLDLG